MIKVKRDINTVFRKEEDDVGMYSMPIVDYVKEVRFCGIRVYKFVQHDVTGLKIKSSFITKKNKGRAGF